MKYIATITYEVDYINTPNPVSPDDVRTALETAMNVDMSEDFRQGIKDVKIEIREA